MAAPMTKLLFLFLLSVASWSRYATANKVTVNGFDAKASDGNKALESWDGDISDNKINCVLNVKENCPGVVQAQIDIVRDGNLVNSIGKSFKQPMGEIRDMNVCESIDGPDPDDDSCSVPQGEQTASKCDMAAWFGDMDPGDYEVKVLFNIDNNEIAVVNLRVTVEAE